MKRAGTYRTVSLLIAVMGMCVQTSLLEAQKRYLYWVDSGQGSIGRVLNNGENPRILVSGLASPNAIAIDSVAGRMYWSLSGPEYGKGKIQSAYLDGSDVQTHFEGVANPRALALDAAEDRIFWLGWKEAAADSGAFVVAADVGTGTQLDTFGGFGIGDGLAYDADDKHLYIGLRGSHAVGELWRLDPASGERRQLVRLDGTGVPLGGVPFQLVVDSENDFIYWADEWSSRIRRAPLDGSFVDDLVVGIIRPRGIAVDPRANELYWTVERDGLLQRSELFGGPRSTLYSVASGVPVSLALVRAAISSSPAAPKRSADVDGLALRSQPNPASASVHLQWVQPGTAPEQVKIVSNLGRIVYVRERVFPAPGQNGMLIDCSHFPAGVYYCILTSGLQSAVVRLVISR